MITELTMAEPTPFPRVMDRLLAGDDAAAVVVFERFSARLVRLAGTRLSAAIRTKADEEDIVQSVFRTFFRRQACGEFVLNDWDGLWSLLVTITVRKCGMHARRYKTEARDVRREVRPPPAADGITSSILNREPTPDQAMLLVETVEELLNGLSADDREMVSLLLQGHDIPTTAARVGRTERTVFRLLARIRDRLEQSIHS